MNGEIVWYNPAKGYGFVRPEDGAGDIVFRFSDAEPTLGTPVPGMAVHFLVGDGERGPVVRHLAPGHVPEL